MRVVKAVRFLSQPLVLVCAILANVLTCALLFRLIEGGGELRALYWAVTTATTTGYGDVSPALGSGMVLAMWLQVTSLIAFGIAVARLTEWLIENPHLWSHDEQEEQKDDSDDTLLMLCLLLEHHGIDIPAGVEEWHGKKPVPNTQEQNIAFRKDWDRRYEEGQRKQQS